MKKIVFFFLLSCLATGKCFSQIISRPILKKEIAVRPAGAPEPILLNNRSPRYLASKLVHPPSGMVQKLVQFSKVYTYPDKTSLHISLRRAPSEASSSFTPKVVPANNDQGCSSSGFNCTTHLVTLTATTTDFMNNNYSAQAAHIYPGAIYTYDHLYDGSFLAETAARNPVIIGTDNKNVVGLTYDTVAVPNQNTISTAIARLYQRFATSGAANGSTTYQIYESSNSSDFNIKIGAGGSGYGFSFDNFFNTDHKEQHVYLTIDVRKTLFTIDVNRPDKGYFKVSPSSTSPLTVIGSVSYGVRILANLELTFKSQTDMDAISASYSGYGVNANADLSLFSSNSSVNNTINAYVVGGASSDTKIAFDKSALQDQIQNILQNANYQNAQPISYELFDLDGGVIGGQSVTDQFSSCVCVPSNEQSPLQSVFAKISTDYNQGDNKDRDTHYSVGLFDQDNNPIASFHDDSDNDEYAQGSDNVVPFKIDNAAVESNFANGGHIHINVAPNGHDTWNIASLQFSLTFLNDPAVKTINWNTINLSQDRRDVDLYFDGSFKAR